MLDDRLLRITIFLGSDRTDKYVFENLSMSAVGTKHSSVIQNVAEIRIANIDKDVRDRLLTEGTPFARLKNIPENSILIEAGRKSTGLIEIFEGDITVVNVTQAPDIWLTMTAITGQHRKYISESISQNASSKFSVIAKEIADNMGLALNFKADDKDVSNFSFSGDLETVMRSLGKISFGVDAWVDHRTLTVLPRNYTGVLSVTEISIDTGMVGIPEFIDFGIRCTVLLSSNIELGQEINLKSNSYPATNGRYQVFKLSFNLANRDNPFYYIIDAYRKDRSSVLL